VAEDGFADVAAEFGLREDGRPGRSCGQPALRILFHDEDEFCHSLRPLVITDYAAPGGQERVAGRHDSQQTIGRTTLPILEILAVAVGLGVDAMSVCMAIGVRWHGPGQKFRLAWHMGLFQFLMPILGWIAGSSLAGVLKSVGTYVAAALVFAIGAKMLWEAVRNHAGETAEREEHAIEKALHVKAQADPTKGWSLVVLSVATSLDALVVGFSLGLKGRGFSIWLASAVIGVTAAAMALFGVAVGKFAGQRLGRWAEAAGAVVLMALGVSFLWA
jgi:manganese efflux pump family protein